MEPPNILWICTDQQRYDTIRSLGNENIRTPNLDRLVREGVAFSHAFCQCPVCTPSRGSFLTGRYPSTNRLRQNGQQIPDDALLVTRLLSEVGYRCGLSGKLHLGPCQGRVEQRIDDGYEAFYWSHSNFPKWKENQYTRWLVNEQGWRWEDTYSYTIDRVAAAGPFGAVPDGVVAWAGQPRDLHQSKWCTDRAIEFIDRYEHGPWLFSINYFDPHHPFDPPVEYLTQYSADQVSSPAYREGELTNKPKFQQIDHRGAYGGRGLSFTETSDHDRRCITAAYYAMIENIDWNVGRLLDHLDKTGQRDNTLIIFMSDHGEMLGDHGIYLKGPYLYDPLMRVPLVISWPRVYRQGLKTDALVELVDLAPTLLEAAGGEPHPGMQGRTLHDICRGRAEPERHRDTVYCEYFNAMPEHRDPVPYLSCIRDYEFKIVVYAGLDEGELYDLRADPGEHENLWSVEGSEKVKGYYLNKCLERMMHTADPMPERSANF